MRQCLLVLLYFLPVAGFAQSLAEDQGVELNGRITVAAYGYSECIVLETHHSKSHCEEIKDNPGERLHIYRVDLSVYNASGGAPLNLDSWGLENTVRRSTRVCAG